MRLRDDPADAEAALSFPGTVPIRGTRCRRVLHPVRPVRLAMALFPLARSPAVRRPIVDLASFAAECAPQPPTPLRLELNELLTAGHLADALPRTLVSEWQLAPTILIAILIENDRRDCRVVLTAERAPRPGRADRRFDRDYSGSASCSSGCSRRWRDDRRLAGRS